MFENENDFRKLISRLNIDNKPNDSHRENLRQQMLSAFNETQQKSFSSHTATWQTLAGTITKSPITKLAAAAVIIMAVLIGINHFSGSIDGASVAWADVIEKLEHDIKSTNTIHILMIMRTVVPKLVENGEVKSVEPHIIKGECWLRRNPFAGKMVLEGEQTTYFTENKFTGLDHRGKKWFEQPVPKEKRNMYGMFDALITGDFKAHQKIPGFNISDGQIVGSETIAGEKATIYEFIGMPSEEKKEEGRPPIHFKCWIGDSDHRTIRMQMHYGDPDKFDMTYDVIEYDVRIPPGTLEVKIPEGYTKHLKPEERIMATVPADVSELKQAYDKARDAFPNYRMIILDNNGNIKRRVAKEGEKWRLDNYEYRRKSNNAIDVSRIQDFDDLWQNVQEQKNNIEATVMSYKKGTARGYWPQENVGGLPKSRYQKHVKFSNIMNTIEAITWPQMSLIGPNSKIELLLPSDEYPGCVGICYSQITKERKSFPHHPQIAMLVIFWIDPTRDYICIRYERHQRKTAVWGDNLAWEPNEPIVDFNPRIIDHSIHHYHSSITEITAMAQSPEGNWYPTERKIQYFRINERGERVEFPNNPKIEKLYIDTQGSIDPNLFEWPEELPPPSK